jgi:AbrB family looped-hinge helix DNA binding protein
MTVVARLSKKNQVVVPREVRETLRLKPGNFVQFVIEDGRVYLQSETPTMTERYFGIARSLMSPNEVDQWLKAIRREWKRPD